MKREIKPFCAASVISAVIALLFPIMTFTLLGFAISNGFEPKKLLAILVGVALSYFVGKPILLNIFNSKFSFGESSFTISYYEDLKNFNQNNRFSIPKKKEITIEYKNLANYGVFKTGDLKKGGRDDNNRKIAIFVNDGIPIPVIIPQFATNLQDIMIFNDKDGNSVVIDTKMYSKKQVSEIFAILKSKSDNPPLNDFDEFDSKLPGWVLGAMTIAMMLVSVIIGLNLPKLEAMIVPSHSAPYSSPLQIIYGIGLIFSIPGIMGLIVCKTNTGAKAQESTLMSLKSAKKFFMAFLIFGIAATIGGFILSLLIDWPQ